MVLGISFTAGYIVYFKFLHPELNSSERWWWGISPEGIGTLGMLLNFAAAWLVSRVTPRPPRPVREMVDRIRIPRGAGKAHELSV
jgi:cation/acetate symporter